MPNVNLPSSLQQISQDQNLSDIWFKYFQQVYEYIRGPYNLRLGGVLNNDYSSTANSGSGETELVNYTFQRRQLLSDGDLICFEMFGEYAANGNNKQIKIVWGSQTIFDTTALAINGGSWLFRVKIIRTAQSTQTIIVEAFYNDLSKINYVDGTQDLNTDIDIKLLATGGASNDIENKGFILNLNPIN